MHVDAGPVALPLARYHVSIVGIAAREVSLSLRPTDDLRAAQVEVGLHCPFTLAEVRIETPAAVAGVLEALIDVGIESAGTTPDDGLDLELMTGDHVAADSGFWSVEASDGRRWEAQPGGGIVIWSGGDEGRTDSQRRLPDAEGDGGRDDDLIEGPNETPVEIGRGVELPGSGLVLTDLEFSIAGRLSLTLEPDRSPSRPGDDGASLPDVMDAFEFFATLNVGPGTVPPDPEVLSAMQAAIEQSDFGLGQGVWISLDGVDPTSPESALRLLRSLGSAAASVHVEPGGRLEVILADGPRLSAGEWWVRQPDGDRWEGSDGRVVRRTFGGGAPNLSPADAAGLADAWLDHDGTGRETRFWAWERVNDVVRRQPSTGWLLVRCLIAGATDERQLMSVAAGPFEDLLAAHSGTLMDRVELDARTDPRVMRALAGVWQNSINDEDWLRIQSLIGR
jgi:hypothetical protein